MFFAFGIFISAISTWLLYLLIPFFNKKLPEGVLHIPLPLVASGWPLF